MDDRRPSGKGKFVKELLQSGSYCPGSIVEVAWDNGQMYNLQQTSHGRRIMILYHYLLQKTFDVAYVHLQKLA